MCIQRLCVYIIGIYNMGGNFGVGRRNRFFFEFFRGYGVVRALMEADDVSFAVFMREK